MTIKILELHHVGFRVANAEADEMRRFYNDLLRLPVDETRWHIPGMTGCWLDVPNGAQIHVLGCDGLSRYATEAGKDPVSNHIALAVEDILAAEAELVQRGVAYFSLDNVASPSLKQIFLHDPAGNMVELHQKTARRPGVAAADAPAR